MKQRSFKTKKPDFLKNAKRNPHCAFQAQCNKFECTCGQISFNQLAPNHICQNYKKCKSASGCTCYTAHKSCDICGGLPTYFERSDSLGESWLKKCVCNTCPKTKLNAISKHDTPDFITIDTPDGLGMTISKGSIQYTDFINRIRLSIK